MTFRFNALAESRTFYASPLPSDLSLNNGRTYYWLRLGVFVPSDGMIPRSRYIRLEQKFMAI